MVRLFDEMLPRHGLEPRHLGRTASGSGVCRCGHGYGKSQGAVVH